MPTLEVPVNFPPKLEVLFQPKRLKVFYGGRGAGRSWNVARGLLMLGAKRKIVVLCAREFQNSIAESVIKVLALQIEKLKLQAFYDVQANKIFGRNGTEFSFEGIKNNPQRIKSYEGIDYCWVEEAAKVTKESWAVLLPTIRRPGSEIWMTFNPELETDYTYKRFVLEADPEQSFVVKMTYKDNPWFDSDTTLRAEMEYDKRTDYDKYLNIWEGNCRQMLEGTVYMRELRHAQEDERITVVPWANDVGVSTFWDLGRADNTAIWFAQKVGMQVRVLAYYEASGQDLPHFIRELQQRSYFYDCHYLPHDAAHKRLGMPVSIEGMLKRAYPGKVQVVSRLSKNDGINAARMMFPECWFDEGKCATGLHALRNYRYEVKDGHFSNEPLHDWASDGADAFRYMAVVMKKAPRKTGMIDRFVQATRKFGAKESGDSPGSSGRWMGI